MQQQQRGRPDRRQAVPSLQFSITGLAWTVFGIAVFFAYYRIDSTLGVLTAPMILLVAVALKQAKRHNRAPGMLAAEGSPGISGTLARGPVESVSLRTRIGLGAAGAALLAIASAASLWTGDWGQAIVCLWFAFMSCVKGAVTYERFRQGELHPDPPRPG